MLGKYVHTLVKAFRGRTNLLPDSSDASVEQLEGTGHVTVMLTAQERTVF
jgi:hypothetical protein